MKQHRYTKGTQVHVAGVEQVCTIHQPLPWTFTTPGYDVLVPGKTGPYGYPYVAISEASLEPVKESEA